MEESNGAPVVASSGMAQPPWTPTTETLRFMRYLWTLAHSLDVRSKWMARNLGVTGPQRLVLRMIGQRPDVSAGDLAAMLDRHPSTLTGILARLRARKLIVRVADPDDRRRVRLKLTAAGRALDRRRGGTVEAAVAEALSRVSAADRAGAERVMAALGERLARDTDR